MVTAMIPSVPRPIVSVSPGPPVLLNVLIVDQHRPSREACRQAATALGCRVSAIESHHQALSLLEDFEVVLLSSRLPDPEIVREIRRRRTGIEVLVVTANSAAQTAVEIMKAGASEYLLKPFSLGQLKIVLERLATQLQARIATRRLSEEIKSNGFGGIIGRAPEMNRLYRIISKAAQSTHPVLILGESGTGKELAARAIHYAGPLRGKPFIPIDCGSLVPTLIESELFGYAKGAFTGATQAKQGLLAFAEGGTVFLDEVGELAIDLQAKLLRALQEKEIRPVGATQTVPINVRILAATNRDLEEAVAGGTFRRDLYFRLNVLNLRIPPLRERRQDILVLANHLLDRISRNCGKTYELSENAMQALAAYDWPGNVRELENCLEQCCAMNSGPVIHASDLPGHLMGRSTVASATVGGISRIADLEREAIMRAITQLNGDKLMAARLLGIGKTTLYRKLKQYEGLQ